MDTKKRLEKLKEDFTSFKDEIIEEVISSTNNLLDKCEEFSEVANEGLVWFKKEIKELQSFLKKEEKNED